MRVPNEIQLQSMFKALGANTNIVAFPELYLALAQGVVDAYHSVGNITIPVIVRLQGTNAKEGKELIDQSGLKVFSAITLQEAADKVKELV